MGRGYRQEEIRERLIAALEGSSTGMSGVELSDVLGINRSTMTKYLKVFAASGLLWQKQIGNLTLWSLKPGQESYEFPGDYFKVAPKFLDSLMEYSGNRAHALVRNCLGSGASVDRMVSEVIIPAIESVDALFDEGKIGTAEQRLLQNAILDSLHILDQHTSEPDPGKNAVVLAADPQSRLLSGAASSSLRYGGWTVFHLGDMSHAIDVLFDLDLQKLLGKLPRTRSGTTAIVIFSYTEEGLAFFSDSVRSLRQKSRKPLKLVLCGEAGKRLRSQADFASDKFDDVMRWFKAY